MDDDDDFFEYFRNKDLSKVRKFNFKKAKAAESPEKSISSLNNAAVETRVQVNEDAFAHNIKQERPFQRGDADASKSSTITVSKSSHSIIANLIKKETNNCNSLDKKPETIVNKSLDNDNKPNSMATKKFTFIKKEGKESTIDKQSLMSPSKYEKSDNILDSLYKSTSLLSTSPLKKSSPSQTSSVTNNPKQTLLQKPCLDLKKNIDKSDDNTGSPSLLSSHSKLGPKSICNISKYFNSPTMKEGEKVSGLSPFKKLLQPKILEETVEGMDTSRINIYNETSTLKNATPNNSPVIKPKKFVFKKNPLSTSTSISTNHSKNSINLDDILSNDKAISNELSVINDDFVRNVVKNDHSLSAIEGDILTATKNNIKIELENFNKQELNKSGSSTPSLEITDADYMDDEEFDQKFGNVAELYDDNTASNIINNGTVADNNQCTEDLLNEISNINWDENVFEDEAIQEGFKDRNDDSEEFRGQYDHSEVMLEVLHQKFGLRHFRPHQREIINASLMQHDCFVLMPTGGGKSLCYQLPAILMPGVTIVISPLRALISDQVDKLNALDIPAAHLCSDVSKANSDLIYMKLSMREPALKLLYLTPEKISASRVIIDMLHSLYQRGKLARFVIDEVHCLSQWGHDFRPDYKQLSRLRKNYKDVPIICLTATATKQVENDVINILHLKNVKRFIRSFNRPNIKYEVVDKKGKSAQPIADLIRTKFNRKSGIVYCLGRMDCEKLADDLNSMGIKSKPYHAGMNDKVREAIQREWMQDRFFVIVATIAFGMGIDKPDVRFVIHNSVPQSVEAFYQESGRAGRDGEVSYSYLFYSYSDVGRLQKLIQKDRNMTRETLNARYENLKQMVSFAENVVDCRRYLQLIHLGEHFDRRICIKNKATTCDNCENIDKYSSMDVTKEAKELCAIVKDITGKENVTMLHVADIYRGAKIKKILDRRHNSHRFYGAGSAVDRNNVQRILKELILKQVLAEFCTYTGDFPVVYIKTGPKFYQFFNSDHQMNISVSTEKRQTKYSEPVAKVTREVTTSNWVNDATTSKASTSKEVVRHSVQKQNTAKLQATRKLQLSQLKVQCHEELLEECRRLAMERNLTLSSVMNLSAIKSMSDVLPATKEEMLKIQHVTVANYNKYGEFFLNISKKFRQKHDEILPLTVLPKNSVTSVQSFSEEEENDFHPSQPAPRGRGNGVKRKRSWGHKRGGFKRKKYSGGNKGKGTSPKGSSGWKSKASKRGGGLGLMPVHIK